MKIYELKEHWEKGGKVFRPCHPAHVLNYDYITDEWYHPGGKMRNICTTNIFFAEDWEIYEESKKSEETKQESYQFKFPDDYLYIEVGDTLLDLLAKNHSWQNDVYQCQDWDEDKAIYFDSDFIIRDLKSNDPITDPMRCLLHDNDKLWHRYRLKNPMLK